MGVEVGTAALIGGGLSAAGSMASGMIGSSAAKSAAKAQSDAAMKQVEANLEQYYQSRADLYPWRTAGTAAINKMMGLMGMGYLPPDTGTSAYGQPPNALAGYYQPAPVTTGGGYQLNPPGTGMTLEQAYQQLMDEGMRTGDYTKVSQFLDAYRASGVSGMTSDMGGPFESTGVAPSTQWATQYMSGGAPYGQSTSTTAAAPINALYSPSMTPDQARAAEMQSFRTSPGYQFRLGEGLKSIERSAAARGGLDSGATYKALQRYGEGLAANEYTDYWNRLAAMAGSGQTASTSTGQLGANAMSQVGQGYMNAGNARASGYIGQANALTGGIASGYQSALFPYYMSLYGGGGGGGLGGYNPPASLDYGLSTPGITPSTWYNP